MHTNNPSRQVPNPYMGVQWANAHRICSARASSHRPTFRGWGLAHQPPHSTHPTWVCACVVGHRSYAAQRSRRRGGHGPRGAGQGANGRSPCGSGAPPHQGSTPVVCDRHMQTIVTKARTYPCFQVGTIHITRLKTPNIHVVCRVENTQSLKDLQSMIY
jgi:hypothetical protein